MFHNFKPWSGESAEPMKHLIVFLEYASAKEFI